MSVATPTIDLAQLEATLVGPMPAWLDSSTQTGDSVTRSPLPGMKLVDLSQADWRTHSGSLLRQRLIAAAIVLVGCLTLVFARSWWMADPVWAWLRGLILVEAIGCLVLLIGKRKLSLDELRGIELALFVPVGIQLYSLHLDAVWEAAMAQDRLKILEVTHIATFGFALLMLAYGMFMPNGWRRTAVMLVPPAVAPITIAVSGLWFYPWLADIFTARRLTEISLVPLAAAAVAVYGAQTISVLRHEARLAKKLGQYRLQRELGRGGMGQVFLAEHQLLKRPCAIKVIHPQHIVDPHALARFEREVRSTARLSHWHTVEVYDYGHTDDGTFYYVMEYLPGMNLSELVQKFGPLPISRAIHFLRQTCAALKEAHRKGMIHRDLKPANIFASERGGVHDVTKLLDFGLVADPRDRFKLADDSLSLTTPFAGSPLYMSPEQAKGTVEIDCRSDIYSLGAVGYFLVTGRPPFEGKSPWKVMLAHARNAVIPPSQFRSDLPEDLEAVLLKCLAKQPADRFQDVGELAEALDNCRHEDIWTYRDAENWWATHMATRDL